MNNIVVKNVTTKNLTSKQINNLCNLKKQHWKFNLKNQLKWFKKNAFEEDNHILIYSSFILIGYVHLGERNFLLNSKNKKYILFRNLIVNKKYRNKNISSLIMRHANNYIFRRKKIGFLICKKKVCNFYIKFNWKIINKKINKLSDHKSEHMKFMVLNNKVGNKIFFYYR
tara:strand:- start:663 stop:1172 length:510 start_codon:yes stop_codon:yes gene_type:complete